MIYHRTSDGKEIAIKNLTTEHLINIINWIEKKAEKGVIVAYGDTGPSADDYFYDEVLLKGEDAKLHLNYSIYKTELNRRLKDVLLREQLSPQEIVEVIREHAHYLNFKYFVHEDRFMDIANAILDRVNQKTVGISNHREKIDSFISEFKLMAANSDNEKTQYMCNKAWQSLQELNDSLRKEIE